MAGLDDDAGAKDLGEQARAATTELVLALLSVSVAVLLIGLLMGAGIIPRSEDSPLSFLYTPASWLIAVGIYRWIGRRIDGDSPAGPVLPRERRPGSGAAWLQIVLHGVMAVAGSAVIAQAMALVGLPIQEQTQVLDITSGGFSFRPDLVLLGLTALAAAPLCEELLFRGMLFRRLLAVVGPAPAYIVSSAAFAAVHFNPAGMVVYLWLGYVFARSYRLTGRLWAAMLVHLVNNAATLAILVFVPQS